MSDTGQPLSVFVFAPGSVMSGAMSAVEEAGHVVLSADSAEEAATSIDERALAALLIESSPAGEEVARHLRGDLGWEAPLVALVGDDQEDPQEAVARMDADGYLEHPFSPRTLGSVLSMADRLREARHELEVSRQGQSERGRRLASAINSCTGFYQFEVVKDLLVVEVRRAKRYGYPLALLLVGLDKIPAAEALNRPGLQRDITAGLAVAIAKSIRDIDIPIHFADDRVLAFLPHTDMAGAEEVGRRVKRRIKRITYRGEGLTAELTASVGVAGLSEGDSLTFSRLIKDASAALKAAQLKGGDRVMKRVQKNSGI